VVCALSSCSDTIVAWVKKKTGPPSTLVDSKEKVEQATKTSKVVVLGYFAKLEVGVHTPLCLPYVSSCTCPCFVAAAAPACTEPGLSNMLLSTTACVLVGIRMCEYTSIFNQFQSPTGDEFLLTNGFACSHCPPRAAMRGGPLGAQSALTDGGGAGDGKIESPTGLSRSCPSCCALASGNGVESRG
jgi:hypothetical protein